MYFSFSDLGDRKAKAKRQAGRLSAGEKPDHRSDDRTLTDEIGLSPIGNSDMQLEDLQGHVKVAKSSSMNDLSESGGKSYNSSVESHEAESFSLAVFFCLV